MFTVNTLERKTWKNEAKMHFSRQAQCQKGEKWPFLGSLFVKARLGFHFWKMNISKSNFLFHSEFQFQEKWNQKGIKNEVKNEWKMGEKGQLWMTLI